MDFGFQYDRMTFNELGNQESRGAFVFQRNATAQVSAPGTLVANTGSGFADFLLGQLYSSTYAVSIANANHIATTRPSTSTTATSSCRTSPFRRTTLRAPAPVVRHPGPRVHRRFANEQHADNPLHRWAASLRTYGLSLAGKAIARMPIRESPSYGYRVARQPDRSECPGHSWAAVRERPLP